MTKALTACIAESQNLLRNTSAILNYLAQISEQQELTQQQTDEVEVIYKATMHLVYLSCLGGRVCEL